MFDVQDGNMTHIPHKRWMKYSYSKAFTVSTVYNTSYVISINSLACVQIPIDRGILLYLATKWERM